MKKSLAIFGEGITEWYYIESLRIARRYPFTMRPSIPQHADIKHMLAQAKKCLDEGYDEVICLMDMDRLNTHPTEMQVYQKAKIQAVFRRVTFIETDPCTEYWFLLHFVERSSTKRFADYTAVETKLRKYLPNYSKSENYLRKIRLYDFLVEHGDLNKALSLARKSADLHNQGNENSYSQMYKLFDKLDEFAKQK